MVKKKIRKLVTKALSKLNYSLKETDVLIEASDKSEYGDYNTNIAFQLAKITSRSPHQIAKEIKDNIDLKKNNFLAKVEVKGGFLNFYLAPNYLQKQLLNILKQRNKFGVLNLGQGKKVNVEFISANPTGPLHIGNARGGFCGDVLAKVLEKAGYKVTREYYVNDMGRQIKILKNSLEDKEPAYRNPYIDELKIRKEKNVFRAVRYIMSQIKKTTKRMGIKYDKWFYESDLYKKKEVDKVLAYLEKKKLVYLKDGALWFKSTKFGDDKDRVVIKADGEKTYFLSEIAYLKNKFKRNFDKLIVFLGAEHHGYIPRMKSAVKALGYSDRRLQPVIYQLVHLIEGGREIKMSKRTGTYITVDELLDEVGLDVARFFFLTRSYGHHLNFDLDLAKEESERNPVYYVQYAHARICSILEKSKKQRIKVKVTASKLKLLSHPSELELMKQLVRLLEVIEDTTRDYQVHRFSQYAIDLATSFHKFYRECRVISEDKVLTQARLALIQATKIVLKNTLNIIGISSPTRM